MTTPDLHIRYSSPDVFKADALTPFPYIYLAGRYFETEEWNGIPGQWWFGGGTDITPSYLYEEDMKHFHGTYKQVCVLLALPHPLLSNYEIHPRHQCTISGNTPPAGLSGLFAEPCS
jgi:hypothetical protein